MARLVFRGLNLNQGSVVAHAELQFWSKETDNEEVELEIAAVKVPHSHTVVLAAFPSSRRSVKDRREGASRSTVSPRSRCRIL